MTLLNFSAPAHLWSGRSQGFHVVKSITVESAVLLMLDKDAHAGYSGVLGECPADYRQDSCTVSGGDAPVYQYFSQRLKRCFTNCFAIIIYFPS